MPPVMSGDWRDLALLNWYTTPDRLAPFAPAGTVVDTWRGRAIVSVVGLRFLHLRAFGVPVPGLQSFAQVNVRFYVCRQVGAEHRRGATFFCELAPSAVLAAGARLALHEPYATYDTRVDETGAPDGHRHLAYEWRATGSATATAADTAREWQRLGLTAVGPPAPERGPGSVETFVLQRCWGYTPQPDGSTLEYGIEHPAWRLWPAAQARMRARWAGLVPAAVADLLSAPPDFALLAEGSAMQMHLPSRLPETG